MFSQAGTKPLHVVVVDDERPILDELRLFGWQECGAELSGVFTNGAEALDFCIDNEVNVIISDVVMPTMNGLELLERIKNIAPHIQFIVLTCHESFRYAQEALRSGALDYIVKANMNDEELVSAIGKARAAIEETSHIQNSIEEKHQKEITALFRQLIGPDADCTAIQKAIQRLFPLKFPLYLPLFYVRFTDEFVPTTQQEIVSLLYESNLPKRFDSELIPLSRKQLLGISNCWTRERIEAYILEMQRVLADSIPYPEIGIHVYGSIGQPLQDIHQIRHYLLASRKWDDLFFFDQRKILFEPPESAPVSLSEEERQAILEQCKEHLGDPRSLFAFLQEQLDNINKNVFWDPSDLKRFLVWWFTALLGRRITLDRMAKISEKINHSQTIDEAIDSLWYFWLQYTAEQSLQHPEIRRALELINKHLDQPITLQFIAKQVGLSSHYLSRLFHAETGKPFNQYVIEAKMQRAAKLLRESTMKVYEVSDSIGIPNYRYFAALFKKHWGMTPIDYRKNVMK